MSKKAKVIAVASAGGHWTQLMRLAPAFSGCEVVYVSTLDPGTVIGNSRFYIVPDANKNEKLNVLRLFFAILKIILKEKPDFVISTGAAPGHMAVRFGHLLGARTLWIDSMANVQRLSLSGKLSLPYADLCLTQWPHLAALDGPQFAGTVV